ncbi:uncharacterized protein LOC120007609 isoform X2 [Tripterygium wilfordii]|uniref:uncharacterized protein LOC120007609 isoform X2 n=1 Tax=Tripterygium wilfordii TaxID=458696 RepID=UPI0018F82018|nr:uncharacterized protein LOC120007609 isoform X2 [Tripterygium wilfordii]
MYKVDSGEAATPFHPQICSPRWQPTIDAMAMQTGIGVSKILIIAGAGYTGTILMKNGKLADLIGELQSLVKRMEKSGEQSDGDADFSDALAAQVRRLSMEVRQLASGGRQIMVLNGNSGNMSSLIVPAATLGALGYGYMWWKGFSFSDLMYVTKRNMATAVTNLTKHLESVTEALSAAKKHLTQRIESLDYKMERQNQVSKEIQANVSQACEDLGKIDVDLSELQKMVSGLDFKIDSLEYKQDIANAGVWYLCKFVEGKKVDMPEFLQKDQLKISGKNRRLLTNSESPSLKGLKDIADALSETISDGNSNLDDQARTVKRTTSAIC